ncbi:hypothetical protein ASG57_20505 [Bradyrhizobium sp. Leaf396]|nr:hypothetical protein ASG57_20505 [Bradyrhizobium sp. Leaf396]
MIREVLVHQSASYCNLEIGNTGLDTTGRTVVVQILSYVAKARMGPSLDFVEVARNLLKSLLKASQMRKVHRGMTHQISPHSRPDED